MWNLIRRIFYRTPKEAWVPMWHKKATWVDDTGKVLHCITYLIKYYPESHRVKLKAIGYKWSDHDYYHSALNTFYTAKVWMVKYDREKILNYIKDQCQKEQRAMNNNAEDLSPEELAKLIQEKLEKEEYKEVAKLQAILDKKLENK